MFLKVFYELILQKIPGICHGIYIEVYFAYCLSFFVYPLHFTLHNISDINSPYCFKKNTVLLSLTHIIIYEQIYWIPILHIKSEVCKKLSNLNITSIALAYLMMHPNSLLFIYKVENYCR